LRWLPKFRQPLADAASLGDLAERLAAKHLELQLAPRSQAGFDATNRNGERFQVKARRLGEQGERQLGIIRNIDDQPFDHLVVVLFPKDSDDPLGIWLLPFDLVRQNVKQKLLQNGHVLYATDKILNHSQTKRVR